MKKIPPSIRLTAPKPTEVKIFKNPELIIKNSTLERVPKKEFFDYSTEEMGYFTRRDSKGNVLELIQIIFPR